MSGKLRTDLEVSKICNEQMSLSESLFLNTNRSSENENAFIMYG